MAPAARRDLQLGAAGAAVLTPEQQKFNRLVKQIERVRADIAAWQEQAQRFAQGYAESVRPLLDELAACRREYALQLDRLIPHKAWTRSERKQLREIVCGVAVELLEEAQGDAVQQLKALHDRHADVGYDRGRREDAAMMKQMFEAMSGVDLGDGEFESEEALLQHAQQRLRDEAAQAPPARARRSSGARRRREQEQQQATKSLREVYRQLASALHPDRAASETERVERTGQMQRVNQAYEANDLLTLLTLQLEIEQIDAAHLARVTTEQAQHYNRVLGEQLGALQAELHGRKQGLLFEFGLDPRLRPDARRLGLLLENVTRGARAELAEAQRALRGLDDPAQVKRWLKEQRLLRRAGDAFDFDPGF